MFSMSDSPEIKNKTEVTTFSMSDSPELTTAAEILVPEPMAPGSATSSSSSSQHQVPFTSLTSGPASHNIASGSSTGKTPQSTTSVPSFGNTDSIWGQDSESLWYKPPRRTPVHGSSGAGAGAYNDREKEMLLGSSATRAYNRQSKALSS